MRNFEFKEIGVIQSCYPDKFGTPRQPGLVAASRGILKIHKEWQPESSLAGLEQFSHLWILFVFHLNSNKSFHAKVHPPRLGGASMGVFATRSPHRANPLGQSLVKIEKVEKDLIHISGLDLVDGTPVIDIKPYLPEVECQTSARNGWLPQVVTRSIEVCWLPKAEEALENWFRHRRKDSASGPAQDLKNSEVRDLIDSTLRQDPRPVVYRGFEGSEESPYRQQHAVRILDLDIHFQFVQENQIEIFDVKVC